MSLMNIFCCGGFGINVGRQVEDLDYNIIYVDTSDSNIQNPNIPKDNIFLVEGEDGAGKLRQKSYQSFKNKTEIILTKFKPSSNINLVVHSLSGGSGSVIGPLITRSLLEKESNVIVLCVDSRQSVIELENSIKTFKSYVSIADQLNKPVAIYYVVNNNRKESDEKILKFIDILGLLLTKQYTQEFDNSDLKHFIYFNKVTDNKPTVGIIEVRDNTSFLTDKGTHIVSTILVSKDKNAAINGPIPDYMSNCVISDPNGILGEDIRIDNIIGKVSDIIESLEREVSTLKDDKILKQINNVTVESNTDEGLLI